MEHHHAIGDVFPGQAVGIALELSLMGSGCLQRQLPCDDDAACTGTNASASTI
jgi:hypothetical protein